MATFPQTVLDAEVSLLLTQGGPWTDITHYAYQREGSSPPIGIRRGRPNESAQCTPASCSMQWNNRDGRFSRGNPTGPYYGQFGRNTPVRVSVPYSGTFARLEDDNTSAWYTPSPLSQLDVTGSIDIRIDLQPSNYEPCTIAYKWGPNNTQWSWQWWLNGDGTLTFNWYDGSNSHSLTSTAPIPLGRIILRVVLTASTGTVTFYTGAGGQNITTGTYTQLGAAVSIGTSTSMAGSAGQPIVIGHNNPVDPGPQAFQGSVYEFEVWDLTSVAVVADAAFDGEPAGTTSFTDFHGNTWQAFGTAEISGRSYRFHGECSSLPQAQDTSGTDIWVPVTASGVLRRLSQGNVPILSAMRRAVGQLSGSLTPVAYWPMEDLTSAQQLAADIGGQAMQFGSTAPSLAASSVFACSAAIPTMAGATINGPVPYNAAGGGSIIVRFLMAIPAGGDTTNGTVLQINTTGTFDWGLLYIPGTGPALTLGEYVPGTGVIVGAGLSLTAGAIYMVSVEITPSGSKVQFSVSAMQAGTSTVTSQTLITSGTATVGIPTSVILNSNLAPPALLTGTAIGHLYVQTTLSSLTTMATALAAHAGETAGTRFARLCAENNIASRIYGFPNVSAAMGPQQIDTLANALQSCEDADRGQMYEPRQCLGLGYRTCGSLINQAQQRTGSPLQIAWTGTGNQLGDGSQVPGITDDDQFTVNDMTVTRSNGSSFQYQLNDGSPMSISPPPVGAGDYDQQLTVYNQSDGQLPSLAGWMVHVGTNSEERFPLIPLNLARTELSALFYSILDLELGDYLQITGAPSWLTPNVIRQLVTGTAEDLGGFWFRIGWNGAPESPFETIVLNDTSYGRLGSAGSVLAGSVTSGSTTLAVAETSPGLGLWSGAGGDLPYDVSIGGERVTVTAVGGWFGSVTAPGTFATITSVTVEAGTYLVQWNVQLGGTVGSGDANNFTLNVNGAFQVFSVNAGAAGFYGQAPHQVTVPGGGGTISVECNSASSAIYTANITSPQLFTVTRSVNGVVKAQAAGTAVSLWFPSTLAMP